MEIARVHDARAIAIPSSITVRSPAGGRADASRRRASPDVAVVVAWRGVCLRRRSRPVVEQLQGRLHAPGEELIGQVAVCQCPGELQGATISPKTVSASVRATPTSVGSRRDAMSSITPISSSVKTCLVAAGRRRSRRAARPTGSRPRTGRGVAETDRRGRTPRVPPDPGLGVKAFALGTQLVGEDVRDEILLGREVA